MALHVEGNIIIAGEMRTVSDVSDWLDAVNEYGFGGDFPLADGLLILQAGGAPAPVDGTGGEASIPLGVVRQAEPEAGQE